MKSNKAKVLHELFYSPMIHHVLEAVSPLQARKTIAVIGHQAEPVKKALVKYHTQTVLQEKQLGTGHAVLCAEPEITNPDSTVMILCGDTPLIKTESLKAMYENHLRKKCVVSLMTTLLSNPSHYGRILSENNNILAIIEEKEATVAQRNIKEINAGIYCVQAGFLFDTLKKVGPDNSQGEVYLTDIVALAVKKGLQVYKTINPQSIDVLGVNSRIELAEAHHQLKLRRNKTIMASGVTLFDPTTISIAPEVSIGADTTIHSGVQINGYSTIGSNCLIEPGAILQNTTLGDNVTIGPYACLSNTTVAKNTKIKAHTLLES